MSCMLRVKHSLVKSVNEMARKRESSMQTYQQRSTCAAGRAGEIFELKPGAERQKHGLWQHDPWQDCRRDPAFLNYVVVCVCVCVCMCWCLWCVRVSLSLSLSLFIYNCVRASQYSKNAQTCLCYLYRGITFVRTHGRFACPITGHGGVLCRCSLLTIPYNIKYVLSQPELFAAKFYGVDVGH